MIFAYFCSTLGHLAGQEETSPISNKAVGNGQCLGWAWRGLAFFEIGSGDFRAGQASTDDTWLNCAQSCAAYLHGKKYASQRNLGLWSSKGVVLLGFACCSGAVPA